MYVGIRALLTVEAINFFYCLLYRLASIFYVLYVRLEYLLGVEVRFVDRLLEGGPPGGLYPGRVRYPVGLITLSLADGLGNGVCLLF